MENPRINREQAAAKRLEMVERFRSSGMTRRAFCQAEGIATSTLNWWLGKGAAAGRRGRMEFSEVRMGPAAGSADWGTELISPRGWTIRCRRGLDAEEVGRLLKSLKC